VNIRTEKGMSLESREACTVPSVDRGHGIGLGGEESMTWKASRLQGVGPMQMLADDPVQP